jgi:hypothetical protein
MLAYFAGRPAGRTWRQSGSTTDAHPSAHKVEPLFRAFGHCSLVMNHLDGLHCWIGLGLTVSTFVLALWLLPL